MKTIKATQRLIDSVWTVTFRHVDESTVEILSYNREDEEGYDNERVLSRCRLIEDDKRIVNSLAIQPYKGSNSLAIIRDADTIIYKVVNPKHVFSYNK